MLAVESRDARFDGWVIVGVTSTGIYCRPSCPTPVRPKRSNMAFFATPASAQAAGFRACKRCAPDAAPGSPEWNRRDDLVARAVRAVEDGVVDREGVDGLARRLNVSVRHLGRLLGSELGVGPLALARARRARAARVLIETTELPFSDIAFAAGFESIRQFNETVREVFALSPTELRGQRRRSVGPPDWISLRLALRRPYPVDQVWSWLDRHAVAGLEEVDGSVYRRSLRLDGGPGVVELEPADGWIDARYRLSSLTDLPAAVQACRRMLDLDADPLVIDAALSADPALGPLVVAHPGLRSPGDVSAADATIRAVLHQQVSLSSARTSTARLLDRFGPRLEQPVGGVDRVFPSPAEWAELDPAELGLNRSRADTIVRVAAALADGSVDVSPVADRAAARAGLMRIKGVGAWTATIVALRGMADPDAFTVGDLAVIRAAARLGIEDDLESVSRRWSPWRSYAMHHLWQAYVTPPADSDERRIPS